MFMVQLNQGTIFEHRDGRAIVGREAVLHVLIQIQRPEPSSMGGSLQEGKHVVTGGPENEFRRDGAVLVGIKLSRGQTLVCNGPTNGVLQVEFVFPP